VKGLIRIESVVGALVEVLHAFTTASCDILPLLCKLYVRMLLFEVICVLFLFVLFYYYYVILL